jgi:hypothetical protein
VQFIPLFRILHDRLFEYNYLCTRKRKLDLTLPELVYKLVETVPAVESMQMQPLLYAVGT